MIELFFRNTVVFNHFLKFGRDSKEVAEILKEYKIENDYPIACFEKK